MSPLLLESPIPPLPDTSNTLGTVTIDGFASVLPAGADRAIPDEVVRGWPLSPLKNPGMFHLTVDTDPAPRLPVDCTPSGIRPRLCRAHAVRARAADGAWWTLTAAGPLPWLQHPVPIPRDWPEGDGPIPEDGTPIVELIGLPEILIGDLDAGWAIIPDADGRCRRTDLTALAAARPPLGAADVIEYEALSLGWRHHHTGATVRFAATTMWPDWTLAIRPDATAAVPRPKDPPQPDGTKAKPDPLDGRDFAVVATDIGTMAHLAVIQTDIAQPGGPAMRITHPPDRTLCRRDAAGDPGRPTRLCTTCTQKLPARSAVRCGPSRLDPAGIRLFGDDGIEAMILALVHDANG